MIYDSYRKEQSLLNLDIHLTQSMYINNKTQEDKTSLNKTDIHVKHIEQYIAELLCICNMPTAQCPSAYITGLIHCKPQNRLT